MSNTIGEVNINLRLSLAQFKKDVQDGTGAAKTGTKEMADSMSTNSREAKYTLALLGQEIGVTMPRAVRGFVASLPGVGAALSAAFSSVAVLVLIELIVKIATKLGEWRKQAEEAAAAMRKVGQTSTDSMHQLDEYLLAAEAQVEELRGNYLQALLDKLREIDNTKMDKLVAEFQKVEKQFDEALTKMKTNWFLNALGVGNNEELAQAKEDFKDLGEMLEKLRNRGHAGDDALGLTMIQGRITRVNEQIRVLAGTNEDLAGVYRVELSLLQDQEKAYLKLNKAANDQKESERIKSDRAGAQRDAEEVRAREQLTQKVREAWAATQVLLDGERDGRDQLIIKIEEQIQKLRDLDAERQRQYPGIKTAYQSEIDALQTKLTLLEKERQLDQDRLNRGIIPGYSPKAANTTGKYDLPIYGGTSAELELEKIKRGGPEAQAALTKVIDATQSINDKFKEQVEILEELHKLYPEVFDEKMLKKAKDAIDPVRQAWKQFGQDVGETIKAAALFGRSWTDALKSIVLELIEVIIKLQIMKHAKDAAGAGGSGGSGGGGGGLFGAIWESFGGGKADGGPLDSGKWYMAGEHGPEPIWGGGAGAFAAGYGGGVQVNYHIDARGATPGMEQKIQAAIKESEDRAVLRAVVTQREMGKRRV